MEIKDDKRKILIRLNKIQGQINGIKKMIEEDKTCNDILVQVSAVRSAFEKVTGIIIENHARECIKESVMNNEDEKIDELIKLIQKFMN